MAKRRLTRNSQVAKPSNEKKLPPTSEDAAKPSTRTRGNVNRNDATESDAQGEETASIEESQSVVNSPARSTRRTRRSQVNVTSEIKNTKALEVVDKAGITEENAIEVGKQSSSPRSKLRSTSPRVSRQINSPDDKQQSSSPSVRVRRTKLRNSAETAIEKDKSNNDDDLLESKETLQEVKQQTSSPKLTRLTRKTNDAVLKKEEKTDDDAIEFEHCVPEIKPVASKRSARLHKTSNTCSNNIAVAKEEKIQQEVDEIEESMPGVNKQTSIVRIPPDTCTVKADISDEEYSKTPNGNKTINIEKLDDDQESSSYSEKLQNQSPNPGNKLPESLPKEIEEAVSPESCISSEATVPSKKGRRTRTSFKVEQKIETVDDVSENIDMNEFGEKILDLDSKHEKSSGISKVPLDIQEHKEDMDIDEMKKDMDSDKMKKDSDMGTKTVETVVNIQEHKEYTDIDEMEKDSDTGTNTVETVDDASKNIDMKEVKEKSSGLDIHVSHKNLPLNIQEPWKDMNVDEMKKDSDASSKIEKRVEVEDKDADNAPALGKDDESNEKVGSALELEKNTEELDYEVSEEEDDCVNIAPEIEKSLDVKEKDADNAPALGKDDDESNEKAGSALELEKSTEELDYEVAEEEDDSANIAPDELVIMEKDPEYMCLFAEEVDEKMDKEVDQKSKQGDKQAEKSGREKRERSPEQEKKEGIQGSSSEKTKTSGTPADCARNEKEGSISKDGKKFHSVYIMSNPSYKKQLKQFEDMSGVHVHYEEKLNSDTLSKTIKNCGKKTGTNALYIIVSGIFTVVGHKQPQECDKCRNKLVQILMPSQSIPIPNFVDAVNGLCDNVLKELGSSDAMIMIPPLPAIVADLDVNQTHVRLHNAAKGTRLCGNIKTIQAVHSYYYKFCKAWIDIACNRIKPWGDVKPFQRYASTARFGVFCSKRFDNSYENSMKEWQDALAEFLHSAFGSSTRKEENKSEREKKPEVVPVEKEENQSEREEKHEVVPVESSEESISEQRFEEVAIIGNTEFTTRLQELTKGLKVVHINESIDLDEDGIPVIKKLQEKHKAKTLWIILSGISEVAKPAEQGPPKCKLLKCKNPLPSFVTRNDDKLGIKECKNMSVAEMVESVVKVAFDFAIACTDELKFGSALFLAPIMPLRAIWAGHATPHSHDKMHKMHISNPNVPFIMGNSSAWVHSTKALERVWLTKIMNNLSEASEPFKLMKKYDREKPSVFGIVEDVTLPEVNEIQEKWAVLMSDIIKFYLHSTSTSETKESITDLPQAPVQPSYPQAPVQPPSYPQAPLQPSSCPQEPVQPFSYPQAPVQPSSYPQEPVQSSSYPQAPVRSSSYPQEPVQPPSYPQAPVQPSPYPQEPVWPPLPPQPNIYPQDTGVIPGPTPQMPMLQSPVTVGPPVFQAPPPVFPPVTVGSSVFQAPPPVFPPATVGQSVFQAPPPVLPPATVGQSVFQAPPPVLPPATVGQSVFQAPPPVFPPGAPGPLPSQEWFPANSVYGPPPALPLVGTGAQVLPAPSVMPVTSAPAPPLMPVTSDSEPVGSGCIIQAAPKLNVPMKGHIIVEGMNTNVDKSQAELIFKAFGDIEEIKWPQSGKLTNFLMIHYVHRSHAERAERLLNYLKPFGENSFVKLVGSKTSGQAKIQSGDMAILLSIHPIVDQIKRSTHSYVSQTTVGEKTPAIPKLTEIPVPEKLTEKVHTIIVKNFPTIVPLQDINDMFVKLGATFKGVLISNALHFTFKKDIPMLKALNGLRLYDKYLDIQIKGPLEDMKLTGEAKRNASLLYKKAVSEFLDKIANSLKENIENEFNVYTFKTRGCRYCDGCKAKDLCFRYHNARDRRRDLTMFRYSDEMCPSMESSGSCEKKDNCSFAHSAVEVMFHYNNFRMNMCPGVKSRKFCDKVGRVCSYLHPGLTEMLYNEKWEHVYVKGLHKSLVYLAEAIKNMYLLKDLQCVRVLLITNDELLEFYLKCVSDLAMACNQKASILTPDGCIEDGTSIVITSSGTFHKMLNNKNEKKIELNRLKVLIIDDCPVPLAQFNRIVLQTIEDWLIKGVNLVLTSQDVTDEDVYSVKNKFRVPGGIRKVLDDSDVQTKPSNTSSSSSGSYKNDLLEMESNKKKDIKTARFKLDIKTSESYSKSKSDQKSTKDRDSNSKSAKDRDSNSKSAKDRDSNSRLSKDRDSNSRSSKDRDSHSRSSKDRDSNSRSSKDRDSDSKSKIEDERSKILSDLKNDYEDAKRALKNEQDKELALYIQSPEFHPEYETKYSLFMEQYKIQFPNKNDVEHSNMLWNAFWKEVINFILSEEYDSRCEVLEKEYQSRKEKEMKKLQDKERVTSKEDPSKAQKRSAPSRQEPNRKYSRSERTQDVGSNRLERHRDRNREKIENRAPKSRGNQSLKIQDDALGDFSLEEAINALNEISPSLGVLGPATLLLCKNIENTWSDITGLRRLFADEDNKLIMQRVADKAKELSVTVELGTESLKLRTASLFATKVLNFCKPQLLPSSQVPSSSSASSSDDGNLGLDIDHIARVTYKKDPTTIIQSIKSALHTKGIVNASEDQISKIYANVTSAHFNMACSKPKDMNRSASEMEMAQVRTEYKAQKREAPESDRYGSDYKYRRHQDNPYNRPESDNPYNRPSSDNPYNRPSSDNPYNRPSSDNPYNRASSDNPYNRPSSDYPYNRPSSDNLWNSSSVRGVTFDYGHGNKGSSNLSTSVNLNKRDNNSQNSKFMSSSYSRDDSHGGKFPSSGRSNVSNINTNPSSSSGDRDGVSMLDFLSRLK